MSARWRPDLTIFEPVRGSTRGPLLARWIRLCEAHSVTEEPLRTAFLAGLPETCTFDATRADLEAELGARLQAGRAAWAGVVLSPEVFVRHLAGRTVGADLPTLERAGDLYIACACAEGGRVSG